MFRRTRDRDGRAIAGAPGAASRSGDPRASALDSSNRRALIAAEVFTGCRLYVRDVDALGATSAAPRTGARSAARRGLIQAFCRCSSSPSTAGVLPADCARLERGAPRRHHLPARGSRRRERPTRWGAAPAASSTPAPRSWREATRSPAGLLAASGVVPGLAGVALRTRRPRESERPRPCGSRPRLAARDRAPSADRSRRPPPTSPRPPTTSPPIGLAAETGLRACDAQAAARLGPRRSSVFQPPGRHLLAAYRPGPERPRGLRARARPGRRAP